MVLGDRHGILRGHVLRHGGDLSLPRDDVLRQGGDPWVLKDDVRRQAGYPGILREAGGAITELSGGCNWGTQLPNDRREKFLRLLFQNPQWEGRLVAAKDWDKYLQVLQKDNPPDEMLPSGQDTWGAWYFLAGKVVL